VVVTLLSIEDGQDEFVLRLRLQSGRTSLDDRVVETLHLAACDSFGAACRGEIVSLWLDSDGLELAVEFTPPLHPDAEPNTRIERLLTALGLTRQLVHGLLAGHLDQTTTRAGRSRLRHVFAAGQTLATDLLRMTVLSVEDYEHSFVVRTRFEMREGESWSGTSQPLLEARDDVGRGYSLFRAACSGFEAETGCVMSLAFRSCEPLGADVCSLYLRVPWSSDVAEVRIVRSPAASA
jgi:hypothetical protein